MALRNSRPLKFQARGLSDTLDGSNVFSGAMNQLVNLVSDPSTEGQWVCRPAARTLTSSLGDPWSPGFSPGFGPLPSATNGVVTALIAVGNILYGMMTTGYLGTPLDVPFSYNLTTNAFVAVSGITSVNCPVPLATTGDWVPPTMTLVGTQIVVCHQGFASPLFVGFIDISNPAAPAWAAGNLTGAITLSTPPTACGQFNQRAYYLINPLTGQPSVVFSDVLVPRNCTVGTQVLTLGDNLPLTAAIGLPLQSSTLGGIVQSLIVFKGANKMHQITGDATGNTLSVNELNVATGTRSPRSIATTPKGIAFLAPDGLRIIDFTAAVSDPIGIDGAGISVPFISALTPSRIAAAYGADVYRATVINGAASGTPTQEYWFDFASNRWSGPHTLLFSCIVPVGTSFVGQPIGHPGILVESDTVQTPTSGFVELGAQLDFHWQTSMLPDMDDMCEHSMVETTIFLSLNPGDSYSVTAEDQNASNFDTLVVTSTGTATLWGAFRWGQAVWGGLLPGIAPQQLPWHYPIVFRRLAVSVSGNSSLAFRIGNMHLRYEKLGYLQQTLAGA